MILLFQIGSLRGMQGEKYTKRQLNSYLWELVALFWTEHGRQRLSKRLPKWMEIGKNRSKKIRSKIDENLYCFEMRFLFIFEAQLKLG